MKTWQKEILERTKDEPLAPIFLCRGALIAELLQRVQEADMSEYKTTREGVVKWTVDELTKMKIL